MNIHKLKEIFQDKYEYLVLVSFYDKNKTLELFKNKDFNKFYSGWFGISDGFTFNPDNNYKSKVRDFYLLVNEEKIEDDEPLIFWDDGSIIDFDYYLCDDNLKLFVLY